MLAPNLADLPAQSFEPDEVEIDPLIFANSGGAELSACTSVPDISATTPFSLNLSADASTCVISGAPAFTFDEQTFTITATNSAGSGTATITLAVEEALAAPILSDAANQILLVGEELDPIIFENTGGLMQSCSQSEDSPLPAGLEVQLNQDLDACEIVGSPAELVAFQTFIIGASNDSGDATAQVDIGVYSTPEFVIEDGEVINLNVGEEDLVEGLLSSTGELDGDLECFVTPDLPAGSSFAADAESSDCILTLFASAALEVTTYSFTAQNAGASNSLSLLLEIAESDNSESIAIPFTDDLDGEISTRLQWSAGDLTVDWGESEDPITYSFSGSEGIITLEYTPDFSGTSTVTLTFSEGLSALTGISGIGQYNIEQPGFLLSTEILSKFENLETLSLFNGELSGDLQELANLNTLETIVLADAGAMVVEASDIPDSVTRFQLNGLNNSFSGNLADLSSNTNLETLALSNLAGLSGNLSELSDLNNLESLTFNSGISIIDGDIASLPENLTFFGMNSDNDGEIFGDVTNLPKSLENFTLESENTIEGSIENLGPNIERLVVGGSNILRGDLGLLQSDLITTFTVSGNNSIDTFNSDPLWVPLNLVSLTISGNGFSGFTTESMDRMLEYFSTTLTPTTSPLASIDIRREIDAAPTSKSDQFIAEIEELGYDVFVNSLLLVDGELVIELEN